MNIDYLETLTLVPFRYIISFFGRINFQCMSSLVYTVYCEKQPSEQRCSVKKGALKDFVNFAGKHLCWSLFRPEKFISVKPDTYFEEHLPTTAFALHSHHSLLLIRFTFTFFLIITTTTVNISDVCFWFKLKRLKESETATRGVL